MIDKRIKEDCPFCGTPADEIQIKTYLEGVTKIHCPTCHVTLEGLECERKLVMKWNTRCSKPHMSNTM